LPARGAHVQPAGCDREPDAECRTPDGLKLGAELATELAIVIVYFFTQPTWLNASRLVPHLTTWAKLTEGAPCEL